MSFLNKFKNKEQSQSNQSQNQSLPPQSTLESQINKPKEDQKQHVKGKPGGGWDDDDDTFQLPQQQKGKPNFLKITKPAEQPKLQEQEESKQQQQQQQVSSNQSQETQPKSESKIEQNTIQQVPNQVKIISSSDIQLSKIIKFKTEFDLLDEDQLNNESTQFENKIINDVIQVGGAKLKQPESQLNEFLKACQTLQVQVISSILFSKLHQQINSIMKIRTIYSMQELTKKYPNYQKFFNHHLNIIENAVIPEDDHAQTVKKELNNLLILVKNPNAQTTQVKEIQFNFNKNNNLIQEKGKFTEENLLDMKTDSSNDQNKLNQNQQPKQQIQPKQNAFEFIKKQSQGCKSPNQQETQSIQNNSNQIDLLNNSNPNLKLDNNTNNNNNNSKNNNLNTDTSTNNQTTNNSNQTQKQTNAFQFLSKSHKSNQNQQDPIQKNPTSTDKDLNLLSDIAFNQNGQQEKKNMENHQDNKAANNANSLQNSNYQYLNNIQLNQASQINYPPNYLNGNNNLSYSNFNPSLIQNLSNQPMANQNLLLQQQQQQQQLYMQNLMLQNQLLFQQQQQFILQQGQQPQTLNKNQQMNSANKNTNSLPEQKKEDPRELAFDFIKFE